MTTELLLGNTIDMTVSDIHQYAKLNRCPCLVFTPSVMSDSAATQQHQQFANQLVGKVSY